MSKTPNDALKAQMAALLGVPSIRMEEPILSPSLAQALREHVRDKRHRRPPSRVVVDDGTAYLYDQKELVGWITAAEYQILKKG